jgi:hypothetical protein
MVNVRPRAHWAKAGVGGLVGVLEGGGTGVVRWIGGWVDGRMAKHSE